MNYNYKYRLYPTSQQEEVLEFTLDTCRQVYNHYLSRFKENGVDMTKHFAQSHLSGLKEDWTELNSIHSRVLHMVIHRLFDNMRSVTPQFQSDKNVDRLRFKGEGWYKTFTYHQSGFDIKTEDTWLDSIYLSKIGTVPINYHRPVPENADIKQATIKKEENGEWYVVLGIEVEDEVEYTVTEEDQVVAVGAGIDAFSIDSDGLGTKSPDTSKTDKQIQRKKKDLARKENGSKNYQQTREQLGELQQHVLRAKRDFLHKLSRYYIDNYDVVIVESRYIGRSNASWWNFVKMLKYKAESAGTFIQEVPYEEDHQYICENCGTESLDLHWLKQRGCPSCGIDSSRDVDHLTRIFTVGLEKLGLGKAEAKPVDIIATKEDLESSLGGMDESGNSLPQQESHPLP